MIKRCKNCGKEFVPTTLKQKHCSLDCRQKFATRRYIEKKKQAEQPAQPKQQKIVRSLIGKCVVCGKKFRAQYHGQKYCSDECRQNPAAIKLRKFFTKIFKALNYRVFDFRS